MKRSLAALLLFSVLPLGACGGQIQADHGDGSDGDLSPEHAGTLLYVGTAESGHRQIFAARPRDGQASPFGAPLPANLDESHLQIWQNADGTRALLDSAEGLYAGDGSTWRKISDLDPAMASPRVSPDLQRIAFTDAGKAHVLSFDGDELLAGHMFPARHAEAVAEDGSAFAYTSEAGISIAQADGTTSQIAGQGLRVAALFPSSVLVGTPGLVPNLTWYSLDGAQLLTPDDGVPPVAGWDRYLVRDGVVDAIADRSLTPLGKAPAAVASGDVLLAEKDLAIARGEGDAIFAFDAEGNVASRYVAATPVGGPRFGGAFQRSVTVDSARIVNGVGTVVVAIEAEELHGDYVQLDYLAYEVWRTDGSAPYLLEKVEPAGGEFPETPLYRITPDGRFVTWVEAGRLQAMDATTGDVITLRGAGMREAARHNVDPNMYGRFEL